MQICPRCNCQSTDEALFCVNCGYPLQERKTKSSRAKGIIIGIIVTVIFLVILKLAYDYYDRRSYMIRMEDCSYKMLEGAAKAEDACNKIVAVWNNCIWTKEDSETDRYTKDENGYFYSDFNDALKNLANDEDFDKLRNDIRDNLEEVQYDMKDLQKPPKGCEQMYDLFMNFYDEYYDLVYCAIDPRGTITTYSDDAREADSKAVRYYDKLKLFFE